MSKANSILLIGMRNAKAIRRVGKGHHAYFLLRLEYQLMKIIQYRNNNATMLIQYGFSKTGFGSVLRYAITLIVTITESIATTIFHSLYFSILLPPCHINYSTNYLFLYVFLLRNIANYTFIFIFHHINCKMLFW